jgi:hypothetical protein
MLCLEVEVNGKRHSLAGVGEGSLSAFVTYVQLRDHATGTEFPRVTESTFLSVSGFLGHQTAVHWGDGPSRLAVGDTVTIRLVDNDQPDQHTVTPNLPDVASGSG